MGHRSSDAPMLSVAAQTAPTASTSLYEYAMHSARRGYVLGLDILAKLRRVLQLGEGTW